VAQTLETTVPNEKSAAALDLAATGENRNALFQQAQTVAPHSILRMLCILLRIIQELRDRNVYLICSKNPEEKSIANQEAMWPSPCKNLVPYALAVPFFFPKRAKTSTKRRFH